MKVRYIWHTDPEIEKVMDTRETYRGHVMFSRLIKETPMTEAEWEKFELESIRKKSANGLILHYEIIEEE